MNDRQDLARRHRGAEVALKAGADGGLLGGGARAQHRADQALPLAHQVADAKLGHVAAEGGDEHQPPALAQQPEVAGQVAGPDAVQDHVDAARRRGDFLLPPAGGVVDRHVGAEIAARCQLCLRTRGHAHRGAGVAGELDGRRADAARAAVNQHGLARGQPRLHEHVDVGGEEHLRQPAALGEAQRVRERHQVARISRHRLRVAAAAEYGVHPVADREPLRLRADCRHLAGHLQTQVGRRAGRRIIPAAPLRQVRPVYRRGVDTYQHLVRLRFRIRHLPPFQRRAGAATHYNRMHRCSISSRGRACQTLYY